MHRNDSLTATPLHLILFLMLLAEVKIEAKMGYVSVSLSLKKLTTDKALNETTS